jgi:hypothetical protein
MKIGPLGTELFHVDGWTGMTKLIVAFFFFVNVPKNVPLSSVMIVQWLSQN